MLTVEMIAWSDPHSVLFAKRFEEPMEWPDEKKADEFRNLNPDLLRFQDFTFYVSGSYALAVQLAKLRPIAFEQKRNEFAFSIPEKIEARADHAAIYADVMGHVFFNIRQLIDDGVKAEDVGTLFPLNVETDMLIKFDLQTFAAIPHRGSAELVDCIGTMCKLIVETFPQYREYLR